MDGDGFDDLILGAPLGDDGGADAGEAYVIFGSAFGLDVILDGNGTAEADILVGNTGNDILTGSGGADSFRGGAGNDIVVVPDLGFLRIDGGSGSDTLIFDGVGLAIDLTDRALASKINSIEHIDIDGSGANTLTLDLLSALNLSGTPHVAFTGGPATSSALVIDGGADDTFELAPDVRGTWELFAEDVNLDGTGGGDYDIYVFELDGGGELAKLAVRSLIDTQLLL